MSLLFLLILLMTQAVQRWERSPLSLTLPFPPSIILQARRQPRAGKLPLGFLCRITEQGWIYSQQQNWARAWSPCPFPTATGKEEGILNLGI